MKVRKPQRKRFLYQIEVSLPSLPTRPTFGVELNNFEPHTRRTGSAFRKVKKKLYEEITNKVGISKIEEARSELRGKRVRIEVLFRLWKGSESITKTRSQKDLDNLLKPVLDVLQTHTDQRGNEVGLDLIENDNLVYEINAKKEIVENQVEEGLKVVILELEFDR